MYVRCVYIVIGLRGNMIPYDSFEFIRALYFEFVGRKQWCAWHLGVLGILVCLASWCAWHLGVCSLLCILTFLLVCSI